MPLSDVSHTHYLTGSSTVPYTVKVSSRAKSVRLKMIPHAGLVVVLPEGFNKNDIPSLLLRHEAWIKKVAERIDVQRPEPLPLTKNGLPYTILFPSLYEEWRVMFNSMGKRVVSADDNDGKRLLLPFDASDGEACRRLLLAWLKRQAVSHLIPSFEKLAAAHDFKYSEALVRLQHSRWGSCNTRGVITLNTKLLFLPEYLVRHIMIHELCHTVQMNHSKAFWDLVCRHDPLCKSNNAEMRNAWKYVPAWVSGAGVT